MDNIELMNPAAGPDPSLGAGADDTEESLEAKQRRLQLAKDEAAKLNQASVAKQNEVKLRQAQFDELTRSLEGYKKCSADSMQDQLDKARLVIAGESKHAADAVKPKKPAIDAVIRRFVDALKQKNENRVAAREAARQAAAATRKAEAQALATQADYELIKDAPKASEQSLKDLAGLIDQASKAKAQGDYAAAYFLICEADTVADALALDGADAYETALIAARNAADSAKTVAAQAAAAGARAEEAAVDAEKKYAAAKASYRSDVLKALRDMA